MAEGTKIEWADHTFNPWTGCTKVSPACDHCYAEGWAKRSGTVQWGPHAARRRTTPANWRMPLKWDAQAEAFQAQHGRRQRVFCASLADVFDNRVQRDWRDDLATLILDTPNLDWLLLTKRIGNAGAMLGEMFLDGPPENIRVGMTAADQGELQRDIDKLFRLRLPNFISLEPMLGRIDLCESLGMWWNQTMGCFESSGSQFNRNPHNHALRAIDWVICGGESGPHARPMHPDWARSLRDQCAAAGVPFLFKQWGEWLPGSQAREVGNQMALVGGCDRGWRWDNGTHSWRIGKAAAGRLLDGVEHNGFPEVRHA